MTESKTFGLRPGVIYEANPSDLSPWARKINYSRPYDQNYGEFLMVVVPDDDPGSYAGQVWMIDTYHMSSPAVPQGPGTRDEKVVAMRAGMESASSSAVHAWRWDCYYDSCVRLTEQNAKFFTELCDLSQFRPAKDGELGDYDPEDTVMGVHLYREHGYRYDSGDRGINLVRRDAAKRPQRQATNIESQLRSEFPSYSAFGVRTAAAKLEQFALENRDCPEVLDVLERNRWRIEFALRVEQEWRDAQRGGSHLRSVDQMAFDIDEAGIMAVPSDEEDE